jgi:hypothetical protein
MKIGIEINGVLRDTIEKFKQVYEKVMIDGNQPELSNQTYELDMSGNTEENVVIPEFNYEVISEVTSLNLMEHFWFKSKDEFFSFMYEESPMEIFGHAPSSEMTTFNELNDLYVELRDQHEITIISDEISKSKPATLFFLSKFGCLIEHVSFYNEITKDEILSKFDLIVTSNPNIIINYKDLVNVIKYDTKYNLDVKSNHTITSIKELKDKIKEITNA